MTTSRSVANELEVLARQVALGLVEQALGLAVLPRDAGQRETRTLPQLVMIDLGHRRSEAILELGLRRLDVLALALQRARLGEVQLDAQDADVARAQVRALLG